MFEITELNDVRAERKDKKKKRERKKRGGKEGGEEKGKGENPPYLHRYCPPSHGSTMGVLLEPRRSLRRQNRGILGPQNLGAFLNAPKPPGSFETTVGRKITFYDRPIH